MVVVVIVRQVVRELGGLNVPRNRLDFLCMLPLMSLDLGFLFDIRLVMVVIVKLSPAGHSWHIAAPVMFVCRVAFLMARPVRLFLVSRLCVVVRTVLLVRGLCGCFGPLPRAFTGVKRHKRVI